MKETGQRWKPLKLSMFDADIHRVDKLSKQLGTSYSEVVRRALEVYEKYQKRSDEKIAAQYAAEKAVKQAEQA